MKTLNHLMDLSGRIALITGGAGHIGSVAAEALAEMGATAVLLDRNQSACNAAAERISGKVGIPVATRVIDLASDEDIRLIPDWVDQEFGRLDILVHCAAFVGTSSLKGWAVPFPQQDVNSWRQAMDVNLTSVFLLSQCCAPALAVSGNGSILAVSSIYGMVGPDWRLYEGTGMGNPAAYAASKGGLLQLVRWMATTLAPEVRVNAISPGGVWRNQDKTFEDKYKARTPLGRMATEEDLKGAVAYFASDLSAYVTGQTLAVDGGWTAW
jgi:NAD(P)-dependent dehydrogenase (short-subunit alcohol dehydrogenase family)